MKIKKYQQYNEELTYEQYRCPICGHSMYRTDSGGTMATLQCGSEEARFWDFNRGSKEYTKSHKHFISSAITIPI